MEIVKLLIGGIVLAIAFSLIGRILFDEKKEITIKEIITILIFGTVIMIVNLISIDSLNKILKVAIFFSCYIGYYKIIFRKRLQELVLASFFTYLIMFISEAIVGLIIIVGIAIIREGSMEEIANGMLANIVIGILAIIITKIIGNKIARIIKENAMNKKALIILIVVILLTLSILLFKIPLHEIEPDVNFIISMILLILLSIIGFILIKQKNDVDKMNDEYQKLANYSQITEGVLEEYRLNLHESRNQLIIIRNMIFTTKKKELKEYVNNLIDATEVNKYRWINELKYIPIPELKGFINFKLMEMSNKKIDIEINVERKLKSSKMKDLKIKDKGDLYNIIGVFLDNAKEASLESKEKRVAIEMYEIDNDVHIVIANTYKGKIDIEKINEYGYSSKGKNRGTGLHLVNKIIERNRMFERTTSKMDEYFVQELVIHLNNIK